MLSDPANVLRFMFSSDRTAGVERARRRIEARARARRSAAIVGGIRRKRRWQCGPRRQARFDRERVEAVKVGAIR